MQSNSIISPVALGDLVGFLSLQEYGLMKGRKGLYSIHA